ncbi:MAG: hypothetical protein A3F33_01365 [Candidatus Woykebacteria bacterium RIFCSPHIGHO2_12_FULL_43_10]|uniref:Uncharacterized protein n=2 Tax=Candidatus Woykeibacteriota TaxID=1817899 RepID=A0A1G1WSV2_9BACT|nr:MAG: hypothetical protein A2802_00225 [Candidatus Woykebacteria bacterium RIFCSPHIGHO2_01_FULL_43_29]OGY29715.1 MAG: hypothetical protein A3J50_00300 [Candidatus Woykebacteria bacterium RIFCSPHIGHO2_02_FULL_43_16b]OGY30407.1 MAG: hypothetical protein A3F33_01365 [Candidatus Woykebacteria bacterium RIFCSPHIGHO2_12_FULL_43_10]OGY30809.1 MAG: hypothetical protein A3A61_00075 [Candidatus Woykebacteria bacterium RIFCSPLOWO2_01_FULL_43_14]
MTTKGERSTILDLPRLLGFYAFTKGNHIAVAYSVWILFGAFRLGPDITRYMISAGVCFIVQLLAAYGLVTICQEWSRRGKPEKSRAALAEDLGVNYLAMAHVFNSYLVLLNPGLWEWFAGAQWVVAGLALIGFTIGPFLPVPLVKARLHLFLPRKLPTGG